MQQLSNDQGVIAALAIDQRGSMKKMMQAAVGEENFSMDRSMNSKNWSHKN